MDFLALVTPLVVGIGMLVFILRLPRDRSDPLAVSSFGNSDWWSLLILVQAALVMGLGGAARDGSGNLTVVAFLTPVITLYWWVSVRHLNRAGVLNRGRRFAFTLFLLPLTIALVASIVGRGSQFLH